MKIHTMVILLGMLAGAAPDASAYQIWVCGGDVFHWTDDLIQWEGSPRIRASAVGFPDGHARSAALAAVVAGWNTTPADFSFDLTWNDGDVDEDNDQNEVWFTGNADRLDRAAAITVPSDDCGDWEFGDGNSEIEEMDIIFACDSAWACAADYPDDEEVAWYYGTNRTSLSVYGGTQSAFRAAAMHELGHALGLGHEDDEYNIMGDAWRHMHTYGSSSIAYPGEDGSDGAVRLYGSSDVLREDVSVVHWRRTGSDGEYSIHDRTRILDENGLELDRLDDGAAEPEYRVNPGQRIRAEFTLENNGSNTQSVTVYLYLSRDRLFGLGDVFLGEGRPTVARNSVYTRRQTLDLPNDLISGAGYFIIAVIDPWNEVVEVNESNNMTNSSRLVVN